MKMLYSSLFMLLSLASCSTVLPSSQGQIGEEAVTFNHDAAVVAAPQNTTDLPSNNQVEAVATQTAWKDETGVYGTLTSIYGSTVADSIPYLYKAEIGGKWSQHPIIDDVLVAKGLDRTTFQTEYAALLVENGFTLQAGTTNLYVNKSVSVEINTRHTSGLNSDISSLYFRKLATTWQEENANIHAELVKVYEDAATASSIPYLPKQSTSNKWVLTAGADSGLGVIVEYNGSDYDTVASEYGQLLITDGYTKGANNNIYTKGTAIIQLASDTANGVVRIAFRKVIVLPQTWEEENANIHAELVKVYGDATASSIPYLSKQSTAEKWVLTNDADSGLGVIVQYKGADYATVASEYAQRLTTDGFTQGTDNKYTKGTTSIQVAPSPQTSAVNIAFTKVSSGGGETTPPTPPATLPQTWQEENANIHAELVKVYGDATATTVPYLSKASTAKKWTLTNDASSGFGVIVQYKGTDYATVATEYTKLLTDNGFTQGADNKYTKGTISIQAAPSAQTQAVNIAFTTASSGGGETTPPTPPATLPQTWQEENANIHAELVKVYGDATATTVPYLSKASTAKKWTLTNDASSGFGVIVQYKGTDYATVATEYTKLLTDNGFTQGADNKYTKGTISIQAAPSAQTQAVNIAFTTVSSGGGETTPPTPPTPPSTNLPTSWQEDNAAIHNELQAIWGNNASTIPYLGKDGVSKSWTITLTASGTGNMAVRIEANATEALAREFYSEYGKHIIDDAGYTAQAYGQGYKKGNIGIKFNVDVDGNIIYEGKIIVTFQNLG